ncbi:type VI secretion system contractile sheath large subunit [Rhodopila globiformis]|uniref:Type VI secretion protein n=1 Tax=Rhodopila globiformis TaxID=1071 RepID=A0A2S6NFD8_RHOGL|nr:type VI secretion system contractile sheath large subunit [Rhodopila globiformis]PPQ33365.1 hypothetical protein CCS01_14625 [Rhodopila globiformis]
MNKASASSHKAPAEQGATTRLRASVLAGTFVGRADEDLAEIFATFLSADHHAALKLWFGTERPDVDTVAVRGALDRDIAAIDAMLSEQIDAILHHPGMLRLEGRWRGLSWLVNGADLNARLKIKLLNVTWPEICRDLDLALEFDQSQLFRKIYEEEFGSPGGEPYGLIIIDHEVRHQAGGHARSDDVSALASLSSVAAAAFSPMILGASPALLEVDHFYELANVLDVTAPLRNTDHARWRGLGTRTDMRFVGVALPRMLARPPWQDDGTRDDGFRYAEYAPGPEHRVWSNAAYGFGAVVARAFATYAWPADLRGVEVDRIGGGLVQHAPAEPFRTEFDLVWPRIPLEIVWNDRQEREFAANGLIPLASVPNTEELVFGAVGSLLIPPRRTGRNAAPVNANAHVSSQLNSILCASRFAHYLKLMGRQMVGSFRTADEIERQLQGWLTRYVNGNLSAAAESRARHPLVAAQVEVREQIGRPGSFGCIVRLQPHYQLDDLAATFQLVTDFGGARL